MDDTPPPQTLSDTHDATDAGNTQSIGNAAVMTMKLIAGVGAAMVLWLAVWMALGGAGGETTTAHSWQWHALISTATLAIVCLSLFREVRHWWTPGRRLTQILPLIRTGELPIESLNTIGGGLARVTPLIEALLCDLRQQKQAVVELEAEMRQRVASRTNALERQLGTMRVQATRDVLTGLNNRRTLNEVLPKLIDAARARSAELSVLAIDVDNFKPLNDTLGHAAGDDLLRSIAQILRSGVREKDVVVRCGGDEFVVLLPGCPTTAATEMGTRLTATVHTMGRTLKTAIPVGLSVGAASLSMVTKTDGGDVAAKALLELADKKLYEVKSLRKGRSQKRSA